MTATIYLYLIRGVGGGVFQAWATWFDAYWESSSYNNDPLIIERARVKELIR